MEVKRWPEESWGSLGQALLERHGADIVVLVGSDPDQAERVFRLVGERACVWQRGALRELAAALSFADIVVGADTGPTRIAAALGVQTVTLFGPSWHGRYGQAPPHVDLQGHPECPQRNVSDFTQQPCWYAGECTLKKRPWRTCLEDVSAEDVLSAVPLSPGPGRCGARYGRRENSGGGAMKRALAGPWGEARRLLVVRLDNIGDVVMTGPVLRALKENLPGSHITLMASPGGGKAAPLLPWVDEVLAWRVLWQDLGYLSFDPAREMELVETLRRGSYYAAIILTSFKQTPHAPGYACYLAGIPLRLGESKEWGG